MKQLTEEELKQLEVLGDLYSKLYRDATYTSTYNSSYSVGTAGCQCQCVVNPSPTKNLILKRIDEILNG